MNTVTRLTLGLSCLVAGTVYGCATMGSAMGFQYDAEELKRAVTFETRCPAQEIEILDAMEAGIGHSKFKLRVCGTPQSWNRFGTSYFLEGKDPMAQAGVGGSGSAGPAAQAESRDVVVASGADQDDRERPAELPDKGEQEPVAEQANPQASGSVEAAPSGPGCACRRDEIESLLKRVADLELQISGQKTNAQLVMDLRNEKDNGWKLRHDAAKLLGERKASEALPDLRQVAASPRASDALKREIENAVQKILSGPVEH